MSNLKQTWFGDANLDSEFNSGDLVTVFSAGKYEADSPAGWDDGDWDADSLFNSSDLVAAFSDGGYEVGPVLPAVAAIPEPTSIVMALLGLMSFACLRRRKN